MFLIIWATFIEQVMFCFVWCLAISLKHIIMNSFSLYFFHSKFALLCIKCLYLLLMFVKIISYFGCWYVTLLLIYKINYRCIVCVDGTCMRPRELVKVRMISDPNTICNESLSLGM
jgi:hypothetical protein